MSKNTIICDLDGTLCDNAHRVDFAVAKDWDGFHSRLSEDEPNPSVFYMLQTLLSNTDVDVLLVTGRPETYRPQTQAWLSKHGLCFSFLLMRPENNYQPDNVIKLKLVEEFFGTFEEALESVHFVLEDRDGMVEAYRNKGFSCWQVSEGKY